MMVKNQTSATVSKPLQLNVYFTGVAVVMMSSRAIETFTKTPRNWIPRYKGLAPDKHRAADPGPLMEGE